MARAESPRGGGADEGRRTSGGSQSRPFDMGQASSRLFVLADPPWSSDYRREAAPDRGG